MKLPQETIDEIASELELGLDCYLHKDTGETIFIPSMDDPYFEEEHWADDLDTIKKNKGYYHRLKKMNSDEEFDIMKNFANTVKDAALKEELLRVLSMKQPFQRFKSEIMTQAKVRDDWFKFKEQSYRTWVKKQVETL